MFNKLHQIAFFIVVVEQYTCKSTLNLLAMLTASYQTMGSAIKACSILLLLMSMSIVDLYMATFLKKTATVFHILNIK